MRHLLKCLKMCLVLWRVYFENRDVMHRKLKEQDLIQKDISSYCMMWCDRTCDAGHRWKYMRLTFLHSSFRNQTQVSQLSAGDTAVLRQVHTQPDMIWNILSTKGYWSVLSVFVSCNGLLITLSFVVLERTFLKGQSIRFQPWVVMMLL